MKSPSKPEKSSQESGKIQDHGKDTTSEATTTPLKSDFEERSKSTPKTDVKQSLAKSLEKLHAFAKTSPSKSGSKNTDTSKPSSSKKSVTPMKEKSQTSHSNVPSKTSPDKKPSSSDKTVTPEKLTPTAKSKSASSVEKKKPSTSGTPAAKITPEKTENKVKDVDVIPSSLERKSSAYRSFMNREGPRALGSKEIPKVMILKYVNDVVDTDGDVNVDACYSGCSSSPTFFM